MIEGVVERLLEAEIGLDVDAIGASALRAAVASRMAALGVRDPTEYSARLESPGERAALIEEVVIPESWFFRDRSVFELVAALAARAGSRDEGLRVLSAPCSGGEEPYTIAMTLLDAGLPRTRFRIDALDVSERLLARAREATFGAFSFRGDDLAYRDRFFTRVEGDEERWRLADEVRGAVTFLQENLVQPDWLPGRGPYDLIFCRNLLIYLTDAARKRLLETLVKELAADGCVVVGHAEALDLMDARFVVTGERGAFAYRLRREPVAVAPLVPPPAGEPPLARAARSSKPTSPAPPEARRRTARSALRRPEATLERAAELADRGELDAAAALCEERLQAAGDDASTHQLLGVVRQAQGDPAAAELCFQRALYCDPDQATAMIHLALLLDRRGDHSGATRLRMRAARNRGSA